MKALRSRTSSAQRELQYQTWRVPSSGPPQLALEISPFNMNAHGQNALHSATPPKTQSPSVPGSPADASPLAPPPRRTTGLRQSSGFAALSRESSPAPELNGDANSPQENSDNRGAGKGAIIRQLGNDKDRLQRQLNAEKTQKELAEKQERIAKATVESLRDENANLLSSHEADIHSIAYRDRRIEDLRAELESERKKSEHYQQVAQRLTGERDDAVERCQRETSMATNEAKQATVSSEILQETHKRLKSQYEHRFAILTGQFSTLSSQQQQLVDSYNEAQKKLARLEVVCDQMAQQIERGKKIEAELRQQMETTRQDAETQINELSRTAQARESINQHLEARYETALEQAQHLFGVAKNAVARHESGRG